MRIEGDRALAQAAARCRRGAGTMEDFQLVVGDLAAEDRDRFVPMAVMGRVRRELGLSAGPRQHEEKWPLFAADVLSFHPEEDLDCDTKRMLAELDMVVASPTTEPVERWGAIFARAVIGPGEGEERRAWCWYDAGAERRAEETFCHPTLSHNAGLIDCWAELERFIDEIGLHEKLVERAGIKPPWMQPEAWIRVDSLGLPAEDRSPAREEEGGRMEAVLTYAVYADLLRMMIRFDALRPKDRDGAPASEAGDAGEVRQTM